MGSLSCPVRNNRLPTSTDSEATVLNENGYSSLRDFGYDYLFDEITKPLPSQPFYFPRKGYVPKGTLIRKKIDEEVTSPPTQPEYPHDVESSLIDVPIKYLANLVNEITTYGVNAARHDHLKSQVTSQSPTPPPHRGGEAPLRERKTKKPKVDRKVLDRSEMKRDISWLPEGWTILEGERKTGYHDKYYEDPKTGKQLRSKNEVLQYLDKLKSTTNSEEVKVDNIANGNF